MRGQFRPSDGAYGTFRVINDRREKITRPASGRRMRRLSRAEIFAGEPQEWIDRSIAFAAASRCSPD